MVCHRSHGVRAVTAVAFALLCIQTPSAVAQPTKKVSAASERGWSPAFIEARAKLDATDYDAAELALRAIRGGEQVDAQLLVGRSLLERGRHDELEKQLSSIALSSEAHRAQAVYLRAKSLWARGKPGDATKALETLKDAKGADGRRLRVLLGELLIDRGLRSEAAGPLHQVIDDYQEMERTDADGLAEVGRAAYLLRSAKDANQAFAESESAAKARIPTLLYRAELFLEKFDAGHAEEVVREILKVAPKHAEALLLMARIKLDQALDFDAAEALLKQALLVNPRLASVFAVRAGIALRDMELEQAERAVDAGLALNPTDLELLSLRAAHRFLSDDAAGFEKAKRDVLQRNPSYAHMFSIVSEFAEWEHRYDDIVSMMGEATKLDPEDGRAWAQLGLTLMRSGREQEGTQALTRSWAKDRYNVMVYNTLNLYEKTIPSSYQSETAGPFEIRYPKAEKQVLERYIPRLAGEAMASMKARYGLVPAMPTHLELYETREHFSVRTSGLPNIGIQGVCFGRVVAAMSPKSEPFNWGNVVWHELGHVFAIQLSKNHVPRWFTEGLSEYETMARRPEWNRELDPQLYTALVERTLPSAINMNRAFTHASDGLDVTVAYYASSQMLIYTVEQFGLAKVVRALRLWGEGKRTPEVIEKAFLVAPAQYDEGFRNWALARLERYKTQFVFSDRSKSVESAREKVEKMPKDARAHAELALALARAHKLSEARAEIDTALALDPKQMSAHYMAAKIAMAEKSTEGARTHLEAIKTAGGDGYSVQMAMAEVTEAAKDLKGQRFALEAAHRYDPSQSEPLSGLYELAVSEKREGETLDLLRKLAPLDQHNRRVWLRLLAGLVKQREWSAARSACESALYVDVLEAETHTLCAATYEALGLAEQAAFESESALLSTPKSTIVPEIHAMLARLYRQLGRTPEAKKHEEAAKKVVIRRDNE